MDVRPKRLNRRAVQIQRNKDKETIMAMNLNCLKIRIKDVAYYTTAGCPLRAIMHLYQKEY